MTGNVWQWWEDRYADYDKEAATDPTGADTGALRVLRGGSWYMSPARCRLAGRSMIAPDNRDFNLGIRIVVLVPGVDSERTRGQ
jgi:formylglycine-generating enzyme required for sulfatase activity